jgi:UDP-glucose 4-epimerase
MSRDAVLITGISGNLGRTLVKLLHREVRIIGLDRRPFIGRPKDVELHQIDIRKKKVEEIFKRGDVETLIHMAIIHDPRLPHAEHHEFNVLGTKAVLSFAAKYGVRKVIVLSSTNIYGPSPDNDNFLTEDSPLLGSQRFADIRDLIEVDMYAQQFMWKHPEVETVILRPVHIVGNVKNAPSNYLRLPRPWTLAGFDPMVQLLHEEDLAYSMQCAMKPGMRGIYNIVGPGELPLSAVLKELDRTPIPVPHFLAKPILQRLWSSRLTGFPPPELDHLQFLCTVDGTKAEREMGYRAQHSLRETIRSVLGPSR